MTTIPLLDIRDLTVEFCDAPRHRARRPAHRHLGRQGRDAGHRRRVRLRQVRHVLCGDAHPRPRRAHRRGLGELRRHRCAQGQRARDAQPARARDLDDLPEPARGPEPDPQGRPPDRGRAAPARPGGLRRQDRKGHRHPRAGAHRAAEGALPRLSVRAVGRHVPARGDRAGAGLPAAAADRRRAHHRPRRHHAEDRDGPDRGADARARHVHHPHHPRSRPRRRLLRPRRGDGERQRGGDGRRGDHLQGALARLYEEADARHAASRRDAARPSA